MGKITLNEALKKASVKNDLQMFLGLDAQSELGGMTPERLAAVAGGLLDKNYTIATDIANNQKLSLRTKGSSLLLFRAGEHPCAALLGLNGKGTVIVESKSNDVLFFQKDIPGKFCIFYDDTTQTFVVQNNYGDARTVTLRVIPF